MAEQLISSGPSVMVDIIMSDYGAVQASSQEAKSASHSALARSPKSKNIWTTILPMLLACAFVLATAYTLSGKGRGLNQVLAAGITSHCDVYDHPLTSDVASKPIRSTAHTVS
eukprot:1328745-Amorphochlora_amoeboformis.AAC.1